MIVLKMQFKKNRFVWGAFTELKKAFVTVYQEILLKKLAHDWFKSYLTNRMQYVSIDGISPNQLKVNFRDLQGSVLGPLL